MSGIIRIGAASGSSSGVVINTPLPGSVPWTVMQLLNDWVRWTAGIGFPEPFEYANPSYRRHPGGIVELKGMIQKTASTPQHHETVCIIPLSCRPKEALLIATVGQKPDLTDVLSSFYIAPDGRIRYRTGGSNFLSFPTATYGVDNTTSVFFGDSITLGSGVTATQRWSYLVSQSLSSLESNQSINGTLLQNTNAGSQIYAGNGRDTYWARIVSEYGDTIFILYGINDLRWNGGSTAAIFQSQLDFIVGDLIKKNISPNNIFLGDIPYVNSSVYSGTAPWNGGNITKHYEYNNAVLTVAQKYRTKFANVYNRMLTSGNNSLLQADGFHPNATGHQVIANAFLDAKIPF